MPDTERLREHSHVRLAPPVQRIDLQAALASLRAEPHDAVKGHRQIAIVRDGPVTVILFSFESGGAMKEHETDGQVTIHVLSGELAVEVAGEEHMLAGGSLLAVSAGLPHRVRATQPSAMLLTVHRRANGSGSD